MNWAETINALFDHWDRQAIALGIDWDSSEMPESYPANTPEGNYWYVCYFRAAIEDLTDAWGTTLVLDDNISGLYHELHGVCRGWKKALDDIGIPQEMVHWGLVHGEAGDIQDYHRGGLELVDDNDNDSAMGEEEEG
jgi:hypothetical protein